MSQITAADIAKALGGRRSGRGFIARCPAHNDRTPSLSITDAADGADARVLIHCFAGCPQAVVIAALAAHGLWSRSLRARRPRPHMTGRTEPNPMLDVAKADKRANALGIWAEAQAAAGSTVETYLRARGLTLPIPPSLRVHPRLKHPSGTYLAGHGGARDARGHR